MGLLSLVTSVIIATMLVVSPPDGTDGSAYREIGTDNSRIIDDSHCLILPPGSFFLYGARFHTTPPIRRFSPGGSALHRCLAPSGRTAMGGHSSAGQGNGGLDSATLFR
jgi:hypothetical protein